MERGRLFYFTRFFVRMGLGGWRADVPRPAGPAVYVCSHSNLRGPLTALAYLPFPARPWVLHVFMDQEACRAQYRDYTFSVRFGLPKPLASFAAWAASGYVSGLMGTMGAVAVYRGTAKIGRTFRESVAALQAGDSLLIFPDVDYTDSSEGIGEVYDGFLLLERFWRKKSEQPLDFIPLRLEPDRRTITAGEPVRFDRSARWRTELVRVRERLREEINQG